MDWLKFAIIGAIVLFLFAQLDDGTQDKVIGTSRDLKEQAIGLITGAVNTKETSVADDGKTILGLLPENINCLVDQECMEAYSCSGCACDTNTGECYYE